MRAAILSKDNEARDPLSRTILEACAIELALLDPEPHPDAAQGRERRCRVLSASNLPLLRLMARCPDLVVATGFGAAALQAACYRALSPHARLLLLATEPPRVPSLGRLLLGRVDGVLAGSEAVADAVERLDFPATRTFPVCRDEEFAAFSRCSPTRAGDAAHRLVYVGDLTPQSGIADFLIAAAVWAEGHPDRAVEIWWAGRGDLRGVLEAQPLPENLSQFFLGALTPAEIAAVFADCGLFVVPALLRGQPHLARQALAAGLPVLGSTHARAMRRLVQDGDNGWLFDPLQPGAMLDALDRALGTASAALDRMRAAARASVHAHAEEGIESRIRRAVRTVLADRAPAPRLVARA